VDDHDGDVPAGSLEFKCEAYIGCAPFRHAKYIFM